jgi:hypothetical protein
MTRSKWHEESIFISIVTGKTTMSTKSTKAGTRSSATESLAGKNVPISVLSQAQEQSANPKQSDGKKSTVVMTKTQVMTAEEVSTLLARLQDILALWEGSDNKIIGGYVMTAFPVPSVMTITKVENSGHNKVFSVNGNPVTALK